LSRLRIRRALRRHRFFIVEGDRYLLANFFQENLKYVKSGQPVEAALDLYPGQIWRGKVEMIWQGSGAIVFWTGNEF